MSPIYIADYNYELPDERIAKYPLPERDHSKLLIYRDGQVSEDRFYRIGDYIAPDALLIYNNTRVIQARLEFHKPTGARIEVFCLEPLEPHDYQLSLSSTTGCTWKCMVGNAKKWHDEPIQSPGASPRRNGESGLRLEGQITNNQLPITNHQSPITLRAYKEAQMGNTYAIRFEWDGEGVSFAEILDAVGELPIPPYLNRKTEESDLRTYQTVYSRIKGSVAAPTAGLHFTQNVLDDLHRRGIETDELTLHVGAGTFLPVKTADANEHTMHTEIIAVPRSTIAHIIAKLGHIVAVGTTSMRTLESLYWIGCQIINHQSPITRNVLPTNGRSGLRREGQFTNYQSPITTISVGQFEPYEPITRNVLPTNGRSGLRREGQFTNNQSPITNKDALQAILDYLDATGQTTLHAETQIMIKPGYTFRIVDQLITNFHQPQSTLLLLVSAFVGGDWRTIYDYALSHDFRFLSYGDSSILNHKSPITNNPERPSDGTEGAASA